MTTTPRGYIIVDKTNNAIDWDCELHPTREAAIESMCGPNHMFVRTPDEADNAGDNISVHWSLYYDICEVR